MIETATTQRIVAALIFCAVLWLGMSWAAPKATARECAKAPVTASGEPASYRWLAIFKARGDWRIRVRSLPSLGADYANWSNAIDIVERCVSSEAGVACSVTATPCRP